MEKPILFLTYKLSLKSHKDNLYLQYILSDIISIIFVIYSECLKLGPESSKSLSVPLPPQSI